MKNRIFMFINRHKNSNNAFVLFLRFIYSISNDWILGIFNLISGAILPNIILSNKLTVVIKVLIIILLIIVNYYFYLVREYKIREYAYRKLSDEIMHSCMVVTNALANYAIQNTSGIGYFEFASDAVCSEMYHCLKTYYGCEFRVSVIQQFAKKNPKGSPYCKMVARRSLAKLKNTNVKEYKINQESNYFYVKLFGKRDMSCYCIANQEGIQNENFIYKSKKHSKIQQYVALLEDAYSEEIAFILQVDCMGKNKLGKNAKEIEELALRFFTPFLSVLNNAYQHERVLTQKNG